MHVELYRNDTVTVFYFDRYSVMDYVWDKIASTLPPKNYLFLKTHSCKIAVAIKVYAGLNLHIFYLE